MQRETSAEIKNSVPRCKADTGLYPRYMRNQPTRNKHMTGTTRTSEGLEPRRAKLLFRSWHRGMREMDLILGRFADAEIGVLTSDEIDQYERLLDISDTDLLPWITGQQPIPENLGLPILHKVIAARDVSV
jgi:antitoxin CptB